MIDTADLATMYVALGQGWRRKFRFVPEGIVCYDSRYQTLRLVALPIKARGVKEILYFLAIRDNVPTDRRAARFFDFGNVDFYEYEAKLDELRYTSAGDTFAYLNLVKFKR